MEFDMPSSGPTTVEPVRFAVVGLGHIARKAVLPGFAHTSHARLAAVCSTDPGKRDELGTQYAVPAFSPGDYEAGLARCGVEAVYIALPNHLHREFAERSARAGVHVLCEKPLAPTVADAEAIVQTASVCGVQLMVALRMQFATAHRKALAAAHGGELGPVRSFHSVFTLNATPGHIRLRQATGGGTLPDLGVYCVNAARHLFQAEPEQVVASTARRPGDDRFKEVEETCCVTLHFSGGRVATFTCAFGSSRVMTYTIVGERGSVHLDPAYDYTSDIRSTMAIDGERQERLFPKEDQFAAEIDYFALCIRKGTEPGPSGQDGLADLRIIEACYQSASSGRSVDLT